LGAAQKGTGRWEVEGEGEKHGNLQAAHIPGAWIGSVTLISENPRAIRSVRGIERMVPTFANTYVGVSEVEGSRDCPRNELAAALKGAEDAAGIGTPESGQTSFIRNTAEVGEVMKQWMRSILLHAKTFTKLHQSLKAVQSALPWHIDFRKHAPSFQTLSCTAAETDHSTQNNTHPSFVTMEGACWSWLLAARR
jgi:hypothetical protein